MTISFIFLGNIVPFIVKVNDPDPLIFVVFGL